MGWGDLNVTQYDLQWQTILLHEAEQVKSTLWLLNLILHKHKGLVAKIDPTILVILKLAYQNF